MNRGHSIGGVDFGFRISDFLHSAIRHPPSAIYLMAVLLIYSIPAWAKGYSIRGNQVMVHTKAHWSAWTFPKGTLNVEDDGVAPRFIRKHINACSNAGTFVHEVNKFEKSDFIHATYDKKTRKYFAPGGIKRVGSNASDASYIMDGDPHTFWEPDRKDPLRQWWVEVDLGRLVCATRLVLRFAEEGEGDPFLKFKVLTSTGERAFEVGTALEYILAGEVVRPNKDQRVFEFDLTSTMGSMVDEDWTGGRAFQYVRVVVTDSDYDKAEWVTPEVFESLHADERGAVEYIWKIAGEERVVDRVVYEKLPVAQQGGIRYYRRERPRLAELEVWAEGDNISLGILKRGGSLSDPNKVAVPIDAFDGALTTWWLAAAYSSTGTGAGWGLLTVDLGALFWVDTVRLVLKKGSAGRDYGILQGYLTRVSDGSLAPDGSFIWERVSPPSKEVIEGDRFRLQDAFEPRKVRYIEFRHVDLLNRRNAESPISCSANVGEVQLYGEGYVPEVILTSDLITLGGFKNITSIEWDADVPSKTKVELRTRTGDELREVHTYFDKSGNEITEQKYNSLPSFLQGEIKTDYLPGSDWSGWSSAYERSGDLIRSPSPRKYLMIQVKLLSDDPHAAATLRSITIHFRNPVAQQVVGEISPNREVPGGRPQNFDLFIKPTFISANPGFDDLLIEAPPGVDMNLLWVSLGDENDFLAGTTKDFSPDPNGVFRSEDGRVLKVLKNRSDSLWVRLPKPVRRGDVGLIRVRFQSTLFLNGTAFLASVGRSSVPGSWQRVDPGDATEKLPSGRGLTVFVSIGKRVIGDVEIAPNPFTPNGDGTNDEVVFAFSAFKVNVPRTVEVVICDPAGRRVKTLSERRASAAGRYVLRWDGKDESGDLVPPGLYLAHIRVGADSDLAESRVVYVVYVAY